MSDNQTEYEIIRDIGYVVRDMKEHDTAFFYVTNDGNGFYTCRCSQWMPHGKSETAHAIEKAFKVTRGTPDPRDARIEQLVKRVNELEEQLVNQL